MASGSLYLPLDEANHEIRLLRIVVSTKHILQCELKIVSLDSDKDSLVYRCLSYAWGEADTVAPTTYILINSHEVDTTPNLRLALVHLQIGPWYWIDALCINQNDDAERARQVPLMTRIYQSAASTDIWLGVEEGNTCRGMDLLHEVDASRKGLTARSMLVLERMFVPEYEPHFDGFFQLLSRPYWKRLWIVQEIVVASNHSKIFIHCGARSELFAAIPAIVNAINSLSERSNVQRLPNGPAGSWSSLSRRVRTTSLQPAIIFRHAQAWQRGDKGDGISLLRLLGDYHEQLCSEPRDRVYALLGVALPYQNVKLPISYSITLQEVFQNVARYIIQGSQRLDVLLYCQENISCTLTLPSWVPNWTVYDSYHRMIASRRQNWDSSKSMPTCASFSPDNSTLFSKAFFLGPITRLHNRSETVGHVPSAMKYVKRGIITFEEKKEFVDWIEFTVSSLQPGSSSASASPGRVTPSKDTIRAFYETLAYTASGQKVIDVRLPFKSFCDLCLRFYKAGRENMEEYMWPHMTVDMFQGIETPKRLFAIDIPGLERPSSDSAVQNNTNTGMTIGLCPLYARIGDLVAVVGGCKHPVVLREKEGAYEVVGEAYVHGVMGGEAVGKLEVVDIKLI